MKMAAVRYILSGIRQSEGDPEDTFLGYGTEYTKEQIEEALKSDVPQAESTIEG